MNSTQIMRSDDLRAENRHRILQTLRTQGPLSRAQIGKSTGLSQAALSTLFSLMTDQGYVTSKSHSVEIQKRGRPKTTVALDPDAALVVTVAITIDKLSFCVVNYAGETVSTDEQFLETSVLSAKQLYNIIAIGISKAIEPHDIVSPTAISIGFQGVTDTFTGELLWSPILSVEKVPIGSMLKRNFNVPVTVHNDCGLIAKALHRAEINTLGDSFAVILFTQGIGLGVYLAGQPFTGAYSSALELGHVRFEKDGALCRCGKKGCIEAYAADYGILRSAKGLSDSDIPAGQISDQEMAQLIAAANDNKKPEIEAFKLAGRAIGFGLATVYTLLDPLPVALVGHNTKAVNLMRTEIEAALKTVGRSPTDYSELLHCFDDDTPLLFDGLTLEAMSTVDRVFAENSDESMLEKALS